MAESELTLPVIQAMRAEVSRGGLSLPDMADIAHLSPYHFIRVFREGTGLPPGAFQAALRLAEAKRLLRESDIPVTEVCFDLGYASLGTFVARFTAEVGLSPSRYRQMCRRPPPEAEAAMGPPEVPASVAGSPPSLVGEVVAPPDAAPGPTFIGLFPRYLPGGLPRAGTARWGAGPFALDPVPDGTYALLAAACPGGPGLAAAMRGDKGRWVGAVSPVRVAGGRAGSVTLALRPVSPVDPPVLLALPLLMDRAVARWERRPVRATG